MAEAIDPASLVPMDLFAASEPLAIDLVYADAGHPENIFGIAAYHPGARLSLQRDLARIVLGVARDLHRQSGWTLVLKDGLRTVEAQGRLMDTDIVRAHPRWLVEPRLLSAPGQGAHPRGMAVDVSVTDRDGVPVDMGTPFDTMTAHSARSYRGFSAGILQNRARLETAFVRAGEACGRPVLPLPSEWWDYRFPASDHDRFAALSDADLPPPLRLIAPAADPACEARFADLAKTILSSL